jgi:hypothetical protein
MSLCLFSSANAALIQKVFDSRKNLLRAASYSNGAIV